MEEGSKVRLVRCPKCENLLPELPDFSVYQCGGCGAVLRAKKKGIQGDEMSGKSDNAKDRENSEDSKLEKDSKSDTTSCDQIQDVKVERIDSKRAFFDSGSSSNPKNRDALASPNTDRRGQENLERDRSKNFESNADSPECNDIRTDRKVRGQVESSMPKTINNNGSTPSRGHTRNSSTVQGRFSNFHYRDEGQLSYDTARHYKHRERARDLGQAFDGLVQIENSEHPDHADLLRRIDELKDQLSRSSDVGGNHKVSCSTSSDPYSGYFLGSSSDSNVRTRQPLASDDPYLNRSKYQPSCLVPPCVDMYSTSVPDSYLQRGNNLRERLQFNDSYRMNYYHQHHPSSQYTHRPFHEDFHHGYYGDYNRDDFALHRRENFFHQPACSCAQCCNKNWCLPPVIDRVGSHNRRNELLSDLNHLRINGSNHRSNLLHPQPSTINPCDFDSENEGFLNYQRPRRFAVSQRSGRVSYPVAGGAPFITCNNCFELLKLPRKRFMLQKDRHEIKCGACSSIISFEPGGNNEVIASVSADIEQVPSDIDEHCSSDTFDENVGYGNNFSNISDVKSLSNDLDESRSQLTKSSSPYEKKSSSRESEKQQLDSFSSTSCDEKISEDKPSRRHGSSLSEIPLDTINSLLHPLDHCDNGNKSSRSERERISSLGRNSSRQISSKDASVETEDEMPLNEISNNRSSEGSVETRREDHSKAGSNKTGKSFLAGLIKKSFKDSTKSNQAPVFVNGHMITHDLVKKAEKFAGPIQPGEYWYDKRAGFWGAMGHPCSGIIMPNIEEFNYPLPKSCAAGNTGIFVNGRELHQQDLDLLANRGLPITRNRSYLIEITGEVVDERTGEELDPLGKLAPTVEKAKRGFGMKVPKAIH